MSGNATGSVTGYGLIRSSGGSAGGNCSLFRQTQQGASQESSAGYGFSIDISHTHNMQHIHSITSDGGDESRPNNYTQIVWKRIK